jgi:anti-anti-sigma regulatory factor
MNEVTLPPVIDRTTAGALIAQFDAALRDVKGLVVEGRDVTRIGQSGLQLMLSLQATASAKGVALTVYPSEAMIGAAEIAGLDQGLAWAGQKP